MTESIEHIAKKGMQTCLEKLGLHLAGIRTGRATPELLSNIKASYYGNETPLTQLANVSVEGGKTLVITPYDKEASHAIEKSILNSDLGIRPQVAGQIIRIVLPPLTEERRQMLVKRVRAEGEQARTTVRHARQEANQKLKKALEANEVTEDDIHRARDRIQQLTDQYIEAIKKKISDKEQDLVII